MEETLMGLYKKEIEAYGAELLEPEEKEEVEKMMREIYDELYHTLSFDDRAKLINLQNCYKQLVAQKQKDSYIKGFVLAATYMLKNDK